MQEFQNTSRNIMREYLRSINKQIDQGIKTAILQCGYQLDEVMQYLKNKQRFEFRCESNELFEYRYFLKDKYMSVTYLLMKQFYSNGVIKIEVYRNLKVE